MMDEVTEITFPCRICGVRLPKRESIAHIPTHRDQNEPLYVRDLHAKLDQLIKRVEELAIITANVPQD